jgi:hypothetical protein
VTSNPSRKYLEWQESFWVACECGAGFSTYLGEKYCKNCLRLGWIWGRDRWFSKVMSMRWPLW